MVLKTQSLCAHRFILVYSGVFLFWL